MNTADPPINAVIFDLDGVIVRTDEHHCRAWQALADAQGIAFDRAVNDRLRGVGRMESLAIILERADREYSEDERVALVQWKNTRYLELIAALTPADVLPGVRRLLDALAEAGVATAIASSSRNAGRILDRIGLADRFDAVVDGNAITRSKPDPGVFLLAAERLGFAPDRCLVVEDADAGVDAALAAGMRVLAVGAARHHPRATRSAADLADVDAASLLVA